MRVNDTASLNVTIESGSGTMSFIGYSDGGFSTQGPGVRIDTDGLWSVAALDPSSIYVSGRAECDAAVISSNRGVERCTHKTEISRSSGGRDSAVCTPDGIGFIGEGSGSTIVQAGGSGALTMTSTTHDSHSYGVHLHCDGTESAFRSKAGGIHVNANGILLEGDACLLELLAPCGGHTNATGRPRFIFQFRFSDRGSVRWCWCAR